MTMTRDEAIELARRASCGFNGGQPDEPTERDGILFWRIGWNASHEFSLGVGPDGKLYRYSCGEGDPIWPEGVEPWSIPSWDLPTTFDERLEEITEDELAGGYWGHF